MTSGAGAEVSVADMTTSSPELLLEADVATLSTMLLSWLRLSSWLSYGVVVVMCVCGVDGL